MRALMVGCKDVTHPHELLLNRRPVNLDSDALPEALVTAWRCPVLHTLGVLMEFPGPGS